MGKRYLEPLRESHPEVFEKLSEQLMGGEGVPGLNNWVGEELKAYTGGADAPYRFEQDDPRVLDMMGIDERGAQLMRSAAARGYLSPGEIERFYKDLKKPTASNRKEFLGPNFDKQLGPFGEGWLQPEQDTL